MAQDYEYDEKTQSFVPKGEKSSSIKKDDERLYGILIWVIQFVNVSFLPMIATVIAYLIFKDRSSYLTNLSKEVLNYEISLLIYIAASFVLTFVLIGVILWGLVIVYAFAIPVIGIVYATESKVYKPQFTLRLIK